MPQFIGIDIDDVLLGTSQSLIMWHNRNFGTDFCLEMIKDYDLSILWNCSYEEMHSRLDMFFYSEEHDAIVPTDGASLALQELHRNYYLVAITGRPSKIRQETLNLLARNGLIDFFSDILFTNSDRSADYSSKGAACFEFGINVFVEDAPYHVESLLRVDVPCLLFDRPWNRGLKKHPMVKRVFSWSEIPDLVHTEVRRA